MGDVVAPAWLSEAALAVWGRLAPDLVRRGVLTPWDVDAFANFCALVEVNRAALVDLDANGATVTTIDRTLADGTTVYRLQRNPSWQVARESAQLLVSIGGRFGLSPSDRAQLHVEPTGAAESDLLSPSRLLSDPSRYLT
jgi:P27 family predicted phage terminase small subunit